MAKDLEKENRKLKKKSRNRGRVVLLLILLLLLIAAAFILFKPFGLGLGLLSGTGFGTTQSTVQETAAPAPADTTTTAKEDTGETVTYIDVTIKDATFILDGSEVSSDDIVSRAKNAAGKVVVRLTNDNGIIDAFDKLTKALEQNNITFEKDASFDVE